MADRTRFTNRARATFLEELSKTANVTAAAAAARISRRAMYDHRAADAGFSKEWDEAVEVATDALVAEARRRAVDGVEEPVYYLGQECGRIRKYSDRMLEILLKAHRPAQFRENIKMEHSGLEDLASAIFKARQRAKGE